MRHFANQVHGGLIRFVFFIHFDVSSVSSSNGLKIKTLKSSYEDYLSTLVLHDSVCLLLYHQECQQDLSTFVTINQYFIEVKTFSIFRNHQ